MSDELNQGNPPAEGAAPAAPPADPTNTPNPEGDKTPEQDAAKAEGDESKQTADDEAEELAIRKKPWFQKRIDEITLARREAERRADRLEETLRQTLARISGGVKEPGSDQEQQQAPHAPAFVPTRPAPTLEQFEFDQDKFMDAVVDWKLEQREAKAQHDRQVAEMQTTQQTVIRSLEEGRVRTLETGKQKYPDFEQTVFALPPNVMDVRMMAAVLQTGTPADICYHLGKHPEEAQKLAALPPLKLAVELGKLEASMASRAARTSQAPPPPNPVGGGRAPASIREDDLPVDEWLKKRQAGQIDGRA